MMLGCRFVNALLGLKTLWLWADKTINGSMNPYYMAGKMVLVILGILIESRLLYLTLRGQHAQQSIQP